MVAETLTGQDAHELFLIDGNSLAYRAFFALPESIGTSDGRRSLAKRDGTRGLGSAAPPRTAEAEEAECS